MVEVPEGYDQDTIFGAWRLRMSALISIRGVK